MPAGRPSSYTPEIAARICAELADGRSLRSVCKDEGMPGRVTVFRWLGEHEEFRAQYAIAKEESAEALADEIVDIADEPPPMTDKGAFDSAAVQHQRLRVDARKWIASKLKPKKYGDKAEVEHKGNVGLTVNVVRLTDAGD